MFRSRQKEVLFESLSLSSQFRTSDSRCSHFLQYFSSLSAGRLGPLLRSSHIFPRSGMGSKQASTGRNRRGIWGLTEVGRIGVAELFYTMLRRKEDSVPRVGVCACAGNGGCNLCDGLYTKRVPIEPFSKSSGDAFTARFFHSSVSTCSAVKKSFSVACTLCCVESLEFAFPFFTIFGGVEEGCARGIFIKT